MTISELKSYLLNKSATTEEVPFGPGVWVYKVMGKMFALVPWDASPAQVSLKCRPAHALELRAIYPAVQAGYHLNKQHWNTVTLDGSIPQSEVLAMIDQSYQLVVQGLTKTQREALQQMVES